MHRRSIQFRLTVWYAAVLIAGLGVFSGLLWFSLRHQLLNALDHELDGRAARFESYFKEELVKTHGSELQDELEEFSKAFAITSFIDLKGSKGFAFRYPAHGIGPAAPSRILRRNFDWSGEAFQLELGASLDDVGRTLELLRWLLLCLIPVVIVIACFGGTWLSKRALRPVRDLTTAAMSVSIENLSERLPVPETHDEIANLAATLNSMLARLEAAVKTLSQFVADASHEFRTPLAVIQTTTELALRRSRTPDSYRESLNDVAAEVARMTNLVEDLLTLARNDTGASAMPFTPLDLCELVLDVALEMRPLADQKEIRIETITTTSAIIAGNRPALRRLLLVLIDNALKFSPPNGEVKLAVNVGENRAIVTIRDFGPGIPAEHLPHIFRRFYRVDSSRNGGGHGLGLSLAESIAKAHGARIEVSSINGASTDFRVEFTLRDERSSVFRESSDCGLNITA